jgi:murein DD-endopeptidase MepM/ murein hydrolase activator NlpD
VTRRPARRGAGPLVACAVVASMWAPLGLAATARAQTGGPLVVATPSEAARERHAAAQATVLARVAELALRIEPAGVGFIRPVAGPVSSPFGWRDLFVSGSRFHGGVDFAAHTGTPVVASRGGRVSFAGWSGVYGYVVFLDHEEGWQTRYAHLSRIDARVGDALRQGSPLGAVGSTGLSTGPHLHFEVRYDGRALDPFGFVPR